jgi:S-adenosylmethionine-diacylglycerol 3-amino-3-carboxypropyl transferase
MVKPRIAFESIFSKIFVYNLLYEDTDVDFRHLDLGKDDRVLSIAGAGCGVAGLTAFGPRSIDVVDRNLSHLSLAAVKMMAPRFLDYEDFYQLLGHGRHKRSRELLLQVVRASDAPSAILDHWRRNSWIFLRGLYGSGLTAMMTQTISRLCKLRREWLEEVVELGPQERADRVRRDVCAKLEHRLVRRAFDSRLQMLSQGINSSQKTRIEGTMQLSFHQHVLNVLEDIARTDLRRNWFAWVPLLGTFNHEDPMATPPYLRRDYYERSAESRTEARWHHRDLFEILEGQDDEYWSYVNCSDAIDWMDDTRQQRLFGLVHRKATPGATLLVRTVEGKDPMERHGLQDRFRLLTETSAQASVEDRSCMYKQVNFYRVEK